MMFALMHSASPCQPLMAAPRVTRQALFTATLPHRADVLASLSPTLSFTSLCHAEGMFACRLLNRLIETLWMHVDGTRHYRSSAVVTATMERVSPEEPPPPAAR